MANEKAWTRGSWCGIHSAIDIFMNLPLCTLPPTTTNKSLSTYIHHLLLRGLPLEGPVGSPWNVFGLWLVLGKHRDAVATRTRRILGWQSCSQRTPMMSSMLLFYAEIQWHSDRPPDSRSRWFLPVFHWFEGRVSTTLGAFEAPCRKLVGRGPSHGLQIPGVGFKPWPLLSLSKIVIHYPWNWYPVPSLFTNWGTINSGLTLGWRSQPELKSLRIDTEGSEWSVLEQLMDSPDKGKIRTGSRRWWQPSRSQEKSEPSNNPRERQYPCNHVDVLFVCWRFWRSQPQGSWTTARNSPWVF